MTRYKAMFVQWYKNTHPNEQCTSIHGFPAVEVSNTEDIDPHYPITQLTENSWLVFIGVSAEEALKLHEQLKNGTYKSIRTTYHKPFLPTTYNGGIRWLQTNNIEILERHRLAFFDPSDIGINGYPKRSYYYIEVSSDALSEGTLINVPHKLVSSTSRWAILLKASGYIASSHTTSYINDINVLMKNISKAVLLGKPYEDMINKYLSLFYEKKVAVADTEAIKRQTLLDGLPTLQAYLMTLSVKEVKDED